MDDDVETDDEIYDNAMKEVVISIDSLVKETKGIMDRKFLKELKAA